MPDESRTPDPRPEADVSPIFLWAALLVALVIVGLLVARFMGRV